jgi:hypothetical protein
MAIFKGRDSGERLFTLKRLDVNGIPTTDVQITVEGADILLAMSPKNSLTFHPTWPSIGASSPPIVPAMSSD